MNGQFLNNRPAGHLVGSVTIVQELLQRWHPRNGAGSLDGEGPTPDRGQAGGALSEGQHRRADQPQRTTGTFLLREAVQSLGETKVGRSSRPRPSGLRRAAPEQVCRTDGWQVPQIPGRLLSTFRSHLFCRSGAVCSGRAAPTEGAARLIGKTPSRHSRGEQRSDLACVLPHAIALERLYGDDDGRRHD
jgi:hypothetical protein